jgi:hypothetical protein
MVSAMGNSNSSASPDAQLLQLSGAMVAAAQASIPPSMQAAWRRMPTGEVALSDAELQPFPDNAANLKD